jgi:hypothetical protein
MWDMSLLTQNLKKCWTQFISKPLVLILCQDMGLDLSQRKNKLPTETVYNAALVKGDYS